MCLRKSRIDYLAFDLLSVLIRNGQSHGHRCRMSVFMKWQAVFGEDLVHPHSFCCVLYIEIPVFFVVRLNSKRLARRIGCQPGWVGWVSDCVRNITQIANSIRYESSTRLPEVLLRAVSGPYVQFKK